MSFSWYILWPYLPNIPLDGYSIIYLNKPVFVCLLLHLGCCQFFPSVTMLWWTFLKVIKYLLIFTIISLGSILEKECWIARKQDCKNLRLLTCSVELHAAVRILPGKTMFCHTQDVTGSSRKRWGPLSNSSQVPSLTCSFHFLGP